MCPYLYTVVGCKTRTALHSCRRSLMAIHHRSFPKTQREEVLLPFGCLVLTLGNPALSMGHHHPQSLVKHTTQMSRDGVRIRMFGSTASRSPTTSGMDTEPAGIFLEGLDTDKRPLPSLQASGPRDFRLSHRACPTGCAEKEAE